MNQTEEKLENSWFHSLWYSPVKALWRVLIQSIKKVVLDKPEFGLNLLEFPGFAFEAGWDTALGFSRFFTFASFELQVGG